MLDDVARFKHNGGCACGKVRFRTDVPPRRVGLCHCMVCRKTHAAPFNHFAIYHRTEVALTGSIRFWKSSAGYERGFCPTCGSHVVAFNQDEAEISVGCFDETSLLLPQYENWVERREAWLHALPISQHKHNR